MKLAQSILCALKVWTENIHSPGAADVAKASPVSKGPEADYNYSFSRFYLCSVSETALIPGQ